MSSRKTDALQEQNCAAWLWSRAMLPALIFGALAPRTYAATAPADPAAPGGADPVTFDSALFPAGSTANIDLSRFEKQGYVPVLIMATSW